MPKGFSNRGISHCAPHAAALSLLCLIVLSLIGCAHNADIEKVICIDDEYSAYQDVLLQALPFYTVDTAENQAKFSLDTGAVVEAFDAQAVPAIEAGAAKYWYPQYLATVVLAIDRDKTDLQISSWSDLYNTHLTVGFNSRNVNLEMQVAAMSYGLEGEAFTLNKAIALLAALQSEKFLVRNSFEQAITICYDYQAAALIRDGRNIEVVVPKEGTLTYEKGLLSNRPIAFEGDVEFLLLANGFRLPDGRCDETVYPGAAAYASASTVKDFERLNTACQDTTRLLRRTVLRTRMYTSADGREHQLFALIYISVVALWTASVVNRAVQKGVRRAALYTGIILSGWMIVRLINYQIPSGSDGNILWYCYYLFQLSLPVVILWLAWSVDKPEEKVVMPRWLRAFFLVNGILIILVLTNNLHNLVFRIDMTNPNWGSEYTYGFVFYLVQAGCYFPLVAGVILLLWKGRQGLRKRGVLLMLGLFGLLVTFAIGYIMRVPIAWESDYTMVVGLFVLMLFETSMRSGMIPVNTKYAALFIHSPLNIQIIDGDGNPALSSTSAVQYERHKITDTLASYPLPVQTSENTLLFAAEITGGHAIWQEDVSGLNRLHNEIKESTRKLETANAVLAEEAKIRRAIEEENARTLLMEQLEAEITGHTLKLSATIEQFYSAEDQAKEAARIVLLLCYLKRRCNLFFREKEGDVLPADELTVYFDELAEIAGYSGVKTIVTSDIKGHILVRYVTLLYDFFYNAAYWATGFANPSILVHLGLEDGNTVLRLLPSENAGSFRMDKSLETAIASVGGTYAVKDLDDAVGMNLSFPGGGEER